MKNTKSIKLEITNGQMHHKEDKLAETNTTDHMFTIKEQSYESSEYQISYRESQTFQDFSTIKYRSSIREEESKLLDSVTKMKQWKLNYQAMPNVSCFDEDQIGEQQIFQLKQSERTLVLPKRIMDTSTNRTYNPTTTGVRRQINVVYECDDEQFEKIIEILQQEGIQLVGSQKPQKKIEKSKKSLKPKGIMPTLKL